MNSISQYFGDYDDNLYSEEEVQEIKRKCQMDMINIFKDIVQCLSNSNDRVLLMNILEEL